MMATRFMASDECWIHDNIKNWICELNEMDTELFCSSILQARGVKNKVVEEVNELEKGGKENMSAIVRATSGKRLLQALESGDRDGAAFLLGQSIGRITEVKSVKAIIDDTMRVCEETLKAKAALFQ